MTLEALLSNLAQMLDTQERRVTALEKRVAGLEAQVNSNSIPFSAQEDTYLEQVKPHGLRDDAFVLS